MLVWLILDHTMIFNKKTGRTFCVSFEMGMNTCCPEVSRIVEKLREPVQVYYPYKNKRARFSKRLAARYELEKSNTQVEDLISQLPDELLVAILSLLSINEAGRSSILSRRWRYLWTFYTGKLEIQYNESISSPDALYLSEILKSHNRESVLDELIIRFPGNRKQCTHLERWVNSASEKCFLRRFELDFIDDYNCKIRGSYNIPGNGINKILSRPGFVSLTCLCFTYVNVTGEVLAHFLATCAFLEQLVVRYSYFLEFLEVSGEGLKLKLLEVYGCRRLITLKINADNLVSLTYVGKSEGLVLERAPHLSKLMIGGKICSSLNDMSCKNVSFIQHLECLKLKLGYEACEFPPVSPPHLPKMYLLKHLELRLPETNERTLLYYTYLIEACPLLSRFTMQYFCSNCAQVADDICVRDDFEHGGLKVVELVGFRDTNSDYELASLLLKIAVSIEKLIISVQPSCCEYYGKSDWKQLQVKLKQLLKLPTSAVLVVL